MRRMNNWFADFGWFGGRFDFLFHFVVVLTFGNKEIENGKCDRVSAEHVITASAYSLYWHAKSTPDGVGTWNT